ncbi:hypothetical protein F5Y13DRAFT_49871 [Hypoxylon sp. FL1857]|nr:hypothetical protein F5Y13DRAFT_49871 [Hypoxylon sp. FL1857]
MSEESDIEDRVASEQDDRPDEHWSDSEDYESEEANEFLDMEASESDGQSDDGDDSSSDDTEPVFFPQFTRLPPELRARVWDFFDVDLKAKARVFDLIFHEPSSSFQQSACLAEQTAPARAMLATHRESRALALRSYPDAIDIDRGSGILRYRSAKDVLLLFNSNIGHLGTILSQIKTPSHVAFFVSLEDSESHQMLPLDTTEKLRSLYFCSDADDFGPKMLQWCVSDSAHSFTRQWTEEEIGIPRVVTTRFCWPDLDDHEEFAKEFVQPEELSLHGVRIWPMVEFMGQSGLDRYREIQDVVATGGEWDVIWNSDNETEDESATEDEYESEGIDDATITIDYLSEDEDDLVVQSGSEEDDVSNFNGFSPLHDENRESNLSGDIGVGNFSSLEPESPVHNGDESEHATSDDEPVVQANRRKRRIVSSDDEHDSEEERGEATQMPSRPAKRSRVVLSDTEDEDNENEDKTVEHDQKAADELEDDESSEEEESDESEEEELYKPVQLPLFEKLRQFREEIPVSPDSESGSDVGESMDNEDFGGDNDINFPDDEVDDEDELLENGEMVTNMEESGEEDEW